MDGENGSRGQRGARRQQTSQAFVSQQHHRKMQRQVDRMVAGGIGAAAGVIQPEAQIRERARLTQREKTAERWMIENGIIVKVKARTERSTERNERSGEEKKSRPHDQLQGYVKRPKTAAERKERLAEIFVRLDRMYPGATCALRHRNPWELLVATILSAQCTDKRVNEVTPGLFAKYPTPQDFAAVRPEVLAQDIRSTGFFNNKAKSVVGAARKVMAEFGGQVPKTMEEMLSIPGAARKTANVVLGTAYGIASGIVVDTHVQRIAQTAGPDPKHGARQNRAGPH